MIIGLDEVGRGCWAGPLVAAAVCLDEEHGIAGLDDSKKLSKKKREGLDILIKTKANSFGLGWVSPLEIDQLGLSTSVQLAMQRAIEQISYEGIQIIIDGSINYLAHIPRTTALVKADGIVRAVSAASIIAKVARDNYMQKASKKFPNYGFESHVGYGTQMHISALKAFGITSIHRKSYKPIKELLASSH